MAFKFICSKCKHETFHDIDDGDPEAEKLIDEVENTKCKECKGNSPGYTKQAEYWCPYCNCDMDLCLQDTDDE